MAPRITTDLLNEKGASGNLMKSFAKLFPTGTEVTRRLCEEHAEQFDFDWAIANLLPWEAWLDIDNKAFAKYYRLLDEAGAEYQRIDRAEYERIRDEADEKHRRIQDEAWAKCLRIRKEVWLEYQRACAVEFARLWNKYMSD